MNHNTSDAFTECFTTQQAPTTRAKKSSMHYSDATRTGTKKHVLFKDCPDVEDISRLTVCYTEQSEYYEDIIHDEIIQEEIVLEESIHEKITRKKTITDEYDSFSCHLYQDGEFRHAVDGRLPECSVACSPARRQTFIKNEYQYESLDDEDSLEDIITLGDLVHEPSFNDLTSTVITQETIIANHDQQFQSLTEHQLPDVLSGSPLRRETYVAESFKSIQVGNNLPKCDIEGSPVRRQTYVKDVPKNDTMRRAALTQETYRGARASDSSEPCTPTPRKLSHTNFSTIAASCVDLLNQLDLDMTASPIATQWEPGLTAGAGAHEKRSRSPILLKDSVKFNNDGATRREFSFTSIMDNCENISQSPVLQKTSVAKFNDDSATELQVQQLVVSQSVDNDACNVDDYAVLSIQTNERHKYIDSSILEPNFQSEQKIVNHLSTVALEGDHEFENYYDVSDVLETSHKGKDLHDISGESEEFQDSLENFLDDVKSSGCLSSHNVNNLPASATGELNDSLHNLSSDTVTLETSIISSADIVNIDEKLSNRPLTTDDCWTSVGAQLSPSSGEVTTEGFETVADDHRPSPWRSEVTTEGYHTAQEVQNLSPWSSELTTDNYNTVNDMSQQSPWTHEMAHSLLQLDSITPNKTKYVDDDAKGKRESAAHVDNGVSDATYNKPEDVSGTVEVTAALKLGVDTEAKERTLQQSSQNVVSRDETFRRAVSVGGVCAVNDTFNRPDPVADALFGSVAPPLRRSLCGRPSEQSFMCASLSEFSFHPSNDPRRCSTGVKQQPSVGRTIPRDGGKQLFLEDLPSDGENVADVCETGQQLFVDVLSGGVENPPQFLTPHQEANGKNSTFDANENLGGNIPSVEPVETKEKHGLLFIEISPTNKRLANSPIAKKAGWSKAKRTR